MWRAIYLSPETSKFFTMTPNMNLLKDLAGKKWIMTENGLKEYLTYPIVIGQDTLRKVTVDTVKRKKK